MQKMKHFETYYVKSFEDDFATKTLKGRNKLTCQTIKQIVKTKIIKPNTISFGRKKRLACTLIHKNYLKTYRSQGIIFQTNQKPDYIFPFDLVLLGATNDIKVSYYRIRNNLHFYYNHSLINGFEKFIFKDFASMLNSIPSPNIALKRANSFRRAQGFLALPKSKKKLVEYNEAVFHKDVKIIPIAIFGRGPKAKLIAKEVKLPLFKSAKEFYKKKVNL